jgi:hypothetical protein
MYPLVDIRFAYKFFSMKQCILLACIFLSNILFAQNNKQNIRGVVIDKLSQATIVGATVQLLNYTENKGTKTNENGKYALENISPGRYELKITYLGYKEMLIPNVVVSSGKETIVDISLEESFKSLKDVTIKATNKAKTINDLASISARTFSMEEVNRYAGGRSDPARLASNFAGVSAPDDSRNDIVIRGNSPVGVLWRIEGMNIPNPNHFATIGTTGGPVSALNTNMLKNSDFFTSAFPAEYGNANAGVFDIGFRKGNSNKREHTFQFGMLTGIEAMTEGPIKKGNGSSYLIAYRYSFTGIAQNLGVNIGTTATPFYTDLSFKLTSGDSKFGRVTLFGLTGTSNIKFLHNNIDSSDLFADPTSDSYFKSTMGVIGVKHFKQLNKKSYFNTIIGATIAKSNYQQDTIEKITDAASKAFENNTKRITYNFLSSYNSKINSKLFIKIGLQADVLNNNLYMRSRMYQPFWKEIWNYNDYTTLAQFFAHAKYSISEKLTANIGLHAQYFFLSKSQSIEPRVGIRYSLNAKSSLNFGYGLHSQMQPLDVYFYKTYNASNGTYISNNTNLGFTKSHHIVIGYDVQPIKDWRIKAEVYYQYLFNVPINTFSSSYSMLNTGSSFSPNMEDSLTNKGTGENYGIELTIEKFFTKGYYGLFTSSIYNATYKGSDGVKHNTAFNGKYVINMLVGKEFKIGRAKRNTFFTDIKATNAGGRYFTPIDLAASKAERQQVVMGDAYAFSQRNTLYFRMDLKMGFTMNSKKKKLSHSFSFDMQNFTNHKNVFAQRYNPVNQSINTAYQIGFFPNFIYKLQF